MARTSYSFFRNSNNNFFTVSGPSGHTHATDKYWSDGLIQVEVSTLSATETSAVTLTNFPYRFQIVDAMYNHYAVATNAGGSIEIYNGTTSNATQYVCGISAQASRAFRRPPTINFNKSTVDKTDTLQVIVEGIGDASCAKMKGMLTLIVRPI